MQKIMKLIAVIAGIGFVFSVAFGQNASIKKLQEQAEQDNPDAAWQLASMAKASLDGTARNGLTRADYLKYLQISDKLGVLPAQFAMAKLYFEGKWVCRNYPGAVQRFEQLTKEKIGQFFTIPMLSECYYYLGRSAAGGFGVRPDMERAYRYFLLASIHTVAAEEELARYALSSPGLRRLPQDAVLIRDRNNSAMFLLYHIYLSDPQTKWSRVVDILNEGKAFVEFENFLRECSDYGDNTASVLLGRALLNGIVFPREIKNGLAALEKAARNGDKEAALVIANFNEVEHGNSVLPNLKQAEAFYKIAVRGTGETAKRAALRLAEFAEERKDTEKAFKYYIMAGKLDAARKYNGPETSAKDIYLQAREYEQRMDPDNKQARESLNEWMRRAANAGYPDAVRWYYANRNNKNFERLVTAYEADPDFEDENFLYEYALALCSGGKQNTKRDIKKGLEFLLQAGEKGSLPALDILIRAYTRGSKLLGIAKDEEKAKYFTRIMLNRDIKVEYPIYFKQYLDTLDTETDPKALIPLKRAAPHFPAAAFTYSRILADGNEKLGVRANPKMAFLLLHIGAKGITARPAIKEIQRLMTPPRNEFIEDTIVRPIPPSAEFMELYTNFYTED